MSTRHRVGMLNRRIGIPRRAVFRLVIRSDKGHPEGYSSGRGSCVGLNRRSQRGPQIYWVRSVEMCQRRSALLGSSA
jgi:hypothetical protein